MLTLQGSLRDLACHQTDPTDRIVVAGDNVVDRIGVTVGVDHGDDRYANRRGLFDSQFLFVRVNDENGTRQPIHRLDPTKDPVELVDLLFELEPLSLGQTTKITPVALGLQVGEALEPGLDRGEVGERATKPALGDVVLPRATSLFGDGLLGLLLSTNEEHLLTPCSQIGDEVVRARQTVHGLLEINDMDAVTRGKNVGPHLRVPAVGLVTEVCPRLEEGLD